MEISSRRELGNNQIKELPPGVLNNNSELIKLQLDNNNLEELPEGLFDGLRALKCLNLGNNQIKELPPGVFNNKSELVGLQLDNNNLKELPEGLFDGLRGLKRLMTHTLCTIIWLVGFLLAFFPMFGLRYFEDLKTYHNYYGKSVVCLPLQLSPDKTAGWEYSVSVFVGLNFFLFIFITAAYLGIFISRVWVKNQSANTRRETGLAKRVFFIIFTDCLCWIPIIVFGLRSLLEENFKPPGDLAVWIAVFALPINSVINPILYTLTTPKVQDYLGGKVAKLRSFLRSLFHCSEEQEGSYASFPILCITSLKNRIMK
ncbi:G-protein coupled receptor GRL101-like, partial [Stylophora pistillata]|uniref:G-protein coupled receptor GRL101-like n=1 Tax=Stylophora pistillata TaxID=50429 RepID=UPI000C0496D4